LIYEDLKICVHFADSRLLPKNILQAYFSQLSLVESFFFLSDPFYTDASQQNFWPNRKAHLNNESVESCCSFAECSVALLLTGKLASRQAGKPGKTGKLANWQLAGSSCSCLTSCPLTALHCLLLPATDILGFRSRNLSCWSFMYAAWPG